MGTQQFCLKWNNHHSNMLTVFEQLLSTEALVDVTLACDGLSLKAHKMVLSACSPFFQSLFLENPCKHPIVIMKDMRYSDLKAIIDFMYRGEVNVSHDQLSALLKTAETLKVKGLAEVSGENRHASGIVQQEIIQNVTTTPQTISSGPPSQQRSETPTLHSKRKRGRPRKRSLSDSNRSDNEDQVPSKIKEPDSPEIEELSGDASLEPNDIRGVSISSNSQSQVSVHPSLQTSTVHNALVPSKTHPTMPSIQSQDSQVSEEPTSGDEGDFEVEPSKLMEQTLTTDNVPALSNSQPQSTIAPVSVHLPLPSSSGLIDAQSRSIVPTASGDSQALVPVSVSIPSDSHSSSQMQGPDSPQDIKPALLSFEEPPISPVAGPSHQSDRSMMMYMDASGVPAIPGPSNYQPDNQTAITQHEQQPQDDDGDYECSNCNQVFKSIEARNAHQWHHVEETLPSSQTSEQEEKRSIKCSDCGQAFLNDESFHICKIKREDSTSSDSTSPPKRVKHHYRHEESYVPPPPPPKPVYYLKCRYCGRHFDKKIYLLKHHCIKEDDNFFRCGTCGYTSHDKADFQTHAYSHFTVSFYKCHVCKKEFRKKESLRSHLCSHGEGEFFCSLCPGRFRDISTFAQHRILHVREHAKTFF